MKNIKTLKEMFSSGMKLDEEIKTGLLYQQVSRKPFHILIIGDPSTAKTGLLRNIRRLVQSSNYVSGALYKSTGSNELMLQQVTKNADMLLIDNLSYMKVEHLQILEEIMDTDVKVIAACNPKFGRFDPYDIIARQIDMPPALLNKFDLVFILKDTPSRKKDRTMIRAFFNKESYKSSMANDRFTETIHQCTKYAPKLTNEAKKEIEDYYVKMRNEGLLEECGIRCVPISLKQVEAIMKMAKANAMLNHSKRVTKKDAVKAISIMHYCLTHICLDPESSRIDIDRIATGITAKEREKIHTVNEIFTKLENESGKIIQIDHLAEAAKKLNIDEVELEECVEKLKRSGDLFEPREGFLQRV